MCGVQPNEVFETVRRIAIEDIDRDVRQAAEESYSRIEGQLLSAELIEELVRTKGPRCWSYVDAVVSACDPWLLLAVDDPLELPCLLLEKPVVLRQYANERLKQRMKDLQAEAEKVDRKKNSDT